MDSLRSITLPHLLLGAVRGCTHWLSSEVGCLLRSSVCLVIVTLRPRRTYTLSLNTKLLMASCRRQSKHGGLGTQHREVQLCRRKTSFGLVHTTVSAAVVGL